MYATACWSATLPLSTRRPRQRSRRTARAQRVLLVTRVTAARLRRRVLRGRTRHSARALALSAKLALQRAAAALSVEIARRGHLPPLPQARALRVPLERFLIPRRRRAQLGAYAAWARAWIPRARLLRIASVPRVLLARRIPRSVAVEVANPCARALHWSSRPRQRLHRRTACADRARLVIPATGAQRPRRVPPARAQWEVQACAARAVQANLL